MLSKLEALVFGFDEFEKAKIDERFNEIPQILNNLKINELKDFEILENVIFKIKELLRVKSSNLNSILKNPKKKLNKKQVLDIVNKLDEIKYDFLKKAFTAIKKEEFNVLNNPKNQVVSSNNLNEIKIFSNDNVKITIENGKVPFILLNFREEIDFVLVKNLSIIFFDLYKSGGTNILTKDLKVLIIPRFENDNLFEMPRVEVNIDEIFTLLNNKNNKNNENIINKEEKKEFVNLVQNDFREVTDKNIIRTKTNKNEDNSLDSLLLDSKDTTFTKKPKPNEDDSSIKLEKTEPIEVKIDKTSEIEVIKDFKKEIPKEKINNTLNNIIEKKKFEIFRDDKIVVYLNENSSVLGELIIENIYGKKLNEIEENVLTYMLMFSKVFGSVLFETKQAHGTNIISNFNDSKIIIIPRYQNDELALNWNLNQATDEELDSVRDKLMTAMAGAMNKDKSKIEKKIILEEKKESNDDLKKKAEHILQSLRRIP